MVVRIVLLLLALICCLAACEQGDISPESLVAPVSNPASIGAKYPFLAANSQGGNILMSWLETDPEFSGSGEAKLLWASWDGQSWSSPEVIRKGDDFFVNWADFPSVVTMDDVPLAAHWLQKVPGSTYAYHVNLAFRSQTGAWSDPVTAHEDLSATEHGFVSMIPLDENRVLAMWLDGYRMQGKGHGGDSHGGVADLSTAMTLRSVILNADGSRSEEWEVDSSVCDCCQTAAVRSGNRIVAVYRNRTEGEIRDTYTASYDLDRNEWSEPRALSREGWEIAGCPVNGPQVAAHGDVVIAAWFTAVNEQPRSYVAVSLDGGRSFGEPQQLDNSSSMGRVGIAFDPEGTALMTWIGPNGEQSAVYGRFWSGSGFEDSFVIGDIESSRGSGFPRVAALGTRFLVAWTTTGPDGSVQTRLVSAGP